MSEEKKKTKIISKKLSRGKNYREVKIIARFCCYLRHTTNIIINRIVIFSYNYNFTSFFN